MVFKEPSINHRKANKGESLLGLSCRLGIIFCSALVFLNACSQSEKTNTNKHTGLSIRSNIISLGMIGQYWEKAHTFELTNDSDDTLTILDITKGCSCTATHINTMVLAPHGHALLTATVNAQNRVGSFVSKISIKWKCLGIESTNDVYLQANAVRVAIVDPLDLEFGNVDQPGPDISKDLTIRRGEAKASWDSVEAHNDAGPLHVKRIDADNFIVSFVFQPNSCSIGSYHDELTIRLKNKGEYLVDTYIVPVSARIVSDLDVTPTSLYFGVISPGEVRKGTFKIFSKAGMPFKLLSVVSSNQDLIHATFEERPEKQKLISYVFNPLGAKGNVSGKIKIRASISGKVRTLVLYYMAYIGMSSDP